MDIGNEKESFQNSTNGLLSINQRCAGMWRIRQVAIFWPTPWNPGKFLKDSGLHETDLTGKSDQVRRALRDSTDRGHPEISVNVTFDTKVKTILHVRNIVSDIQSAYNEYVPRKMGEESRPRFRNKG